MRALNAPISSSSPPTISKPLSSSPSAPASATRKPPSSSAAISTNSPKSLRASAPTKSSPAPRAPSTKLQRTSAPPVDFPRRRERLGFLAKQEGPLQTLIGCSWLRSRHGLRDSAGKRLKLPRFSVSFVGLHKPDLTILEMDEQLFVLRRIDVPRPQDLGRINLRAVIDPLIVDVVKFGIPHHDKVFARCVAKLVGYLGAFRDSTARPLQLIALMVQRAAGSLDEQNHHDHAHHHGSKPPALYFHRVHMPQHLNHQKNQHTHQRGDIVWSSPHHRKDAERDQEKNSERQPHFPVSEEKKHERQEQQLGPPEKEATHQIEFLQRYAASVLPCRAVIRALPSVVKILELRVPVVQRRLGMLPEEHGRREMSFGV